MFFLNRRSCRVFSRGYLKRNPTQGLQWSDF